MASSNKKTKTVTTKEAPIFTHEGARAVPVGPESQLQRTCMNSLLFEETFYEDGMAAPDRVKLLIPACRPEFVAGLAVNARTAMKLRHMPLLMVREMARQPKHKHMVAVVLPQIIKRADELTEFLAIYWKDNGGKRTLSAQVKKGLSAAFRNFNEYDFAKYDRDGPVKLRDALFLSHAKPVDATIKYTKHQRKVKRDDYVLAPAETLYKKIVDRTLETPETWEVELSAGGDKKEVFTKLMLDKKLGGLAFLRNLRNMNQAGVEKSLVDAYMDEANFDRVLPFRFISAARHVPKWESTIERGMLRCLSGVEKLPGKTAIVVDNSGSMSGAKVSAKSEIDRSDAACALAILLREICAEVVVIGYGTDAKVIPDRRGFALAEAIKKGPGGGTDTHKAVQLAAREGYDRIIVVTDEQSHTAVKAPLIPGMGYFINVANYQNGIGYGPWVHVDGWSEAIVEYIRVYEKTLEK